MTAGDDLCLAQEDGDRSTALAAGSAPGESGVSILSVDFRGSAHFSATPRRHLIWFHLSPRAHFACRLAGRSVSHDVPAGSLAICPAGIDCAADAGESVAAIMVAIDPGRLALAAAEDSAPEPRLMERFCGRDMTLLERARILVRESAEGYPNGPLFWNQIADDFTDGLLARHSSAIDCGPRGQLGKEVLRRIRDHVLAHIGEPIEVAALARIAGRSPFHFSRVFARSVGMTPHRYIVHLRLQAAIVLVRSGRPGLAEIAMRTGFADQSHLSRWVRRVHGVPLTRLDA
ncbi:MAG TPA: AraC family transcriptional regulator [Dongiaceae bacterium]|nr:AraC family transcriptional regulator [Dongiaceae bacterium]